MWVGAILFDMAQEQSTGAPATKSPFSHSLYRSVVTQYWPFTMYVLAYVTVGMVLAGITHGWNWTVYAVAVATIWTGLEGLHAIDLSHDDIATRVDSSLQKKVGVISVVIGGVLGVFLAYLTTPWFILVVVAGIFLGIAYNEEWFGGLLHDFDTLPGLVNFGFSWGFIPAVGGYFLLSGSLTPGILVFGLGIMFDAFALITLFEVSKPAPYDAHGIEHSRQFEHDPQWLTTEAHKTNQYKMVSWVLIAIGVLLLFVV